MANVLYTLCQLEVVVLVEADAEIIPLPVEIAAPRHFLAGIGERVGELL